ncbi:MAG: ornithine carbamoyltransferase [Porticoccaceae bacterium]
MTHSIRGRSLLTLKDFSPEEIDGLLQQAVELKADKKQRREKKQLLGKAIALIFEKNSTRTRSGFEVAAFDQGAHVTYLGPTGTQIGEKETTKDTARVLGRIYDGIEYRGFDQTTVEELAIFSGVHVFNGLTGEYHPTQILADFLTMQEHSKKQLSDIRFCYIGDARNNVGTRYYWAGRRWVWTPEYARRKPFNPKR